MICYKKGVFSRKPPSAINGTFVYYLYVKLLCNYLKQNILSPCTNAMLCFNWVTWGNLIVYWVYIYDIYNTALIVTVNKVYAANISIVK